MKDILLIGAGGGTREIIELVHEINNVVPQWRVVGILDDDVRCHGQDINGVKVLGPIARDDAYKGQYIIGIASSQNRSIRLAIQQRLDVEAERFATLIAPSVHVARTATVGAGCVLAPGVVIGPNATVGNHVFTGPLVVISHDDVIGDGVTLANGAAVCGGVSIGASTYIGCKAAIRENLIIGENVLIGMGAVVVKNIAAGQTVAGNPAQPLETKTTPIVWQAG